MSVSGYIKEFFIWTHAAAVTLSISYAILCVPIWVMARTTFSA